MFSVIIPVYNGERFIDKAIQSVLAQTFNEFEIVIVNDGSTDNTLKVLEKYAENDKIKIISQKNGGVSAARNTAMENASYDYFAFLDCDDTWFDNHLETLKEMIDKYPDAGSYATLGNINLPNGKNITNAAYFTDNGYTEDTLYIKDFISEYDRDKRAKTHYPCNFCVSRKAAEKTGGFKIDCKIGEDLAFCLVAGLYYPVVLSKKITGIYDRENSTATKDVSFDPDWYFFEDVKRFLNDDSVPTESKESLKRVMQWFTMRRCRHYIIDGKKKEARKSYREIGNDSKLKKDKFLTYILLHMPVWLVRKIFIARWRTIG